MSNLGTSNIPGTTLISTLGKPQWNKTTGTPGTDILFYEDDFMYFVNSGGTVLWPWNPAGDGSTGTALIKVGTAANPGIVELATGNSSTGKAALLRGNSFAGSTPGNLLLGGGAIDIVGIVQVPVLSTGAEEFVCYFGIGDGLEPFQAAGGNNGVYIRYVRTTSTNWQGITRNASTTTTASGGSNVAVGTGFAFLRISINAAATLATFYVNNTLIGTSSTNIPTSNAISHGHVINKTVGTTSRSFNVDYASFFYQLTTSRFQ